MFDKAPKDIVNLGSEVFEEIPFYRRKNASNVIYINEQLYEQVFQKTFEYDTACEDIIEKFAVGLEKNGKVIGNGYVDRQSDPTGIALNGNIGSGRAFYLYECFNIKGDKTPFATSARNDYNNGKYALDCAIHEALISNVLASSKKFENFKTLAVIDIDFEYLFPHTREKLPCGLIIRYYENNELYRFSHRFVNKMPFNKNEILEISQKIGQMEGMKFIERFLHGAWSIGNLSIDSNMIDLDTSFFTKGRQPQWSYTSKYITNYFGFEEKGQIKVLETVLNSDLNIDSVTLDKVTKIIDDTKRNTIRREFSKLIGYSDDIYLKYRNEFDELADIFYDMSKLFFDNYDNLNCADRYLDNNNLFDFSKLFRYYELGKQNGKFNTGYLLNLLINKSAESLSYEYDNQEHQDKIKKFFGDIIIDSKEKYIDSINKAIVFIEKFIKLIDIIDSNEIIDTNSKLVLSYVRNEDRKYLTGRKWLRGELIDLYNEKGSKIVNDVMNTIISNYAFREVDTGRYLTDLYIFDKGIIYRKINTNGYNRFVLKLFDKIFNREVIININGNDVLFDIANDGLFYSEYYDNKLLSEITDVSIIEDNKITETIEIGRDNYLKRYIQFIDYNDNINDSFITTILRDNYNIDVFKMTRIVGGSTNCYCVESSHKKYFLKIFEKGKPIETLLLEYKLLNILKKNNFKVTNIIKTNNNRIGLLHDDQLIVLADFIDGHVYHDEVLPRSILLDSAKTLGRMHKILNTRYCADNAISKWNNFDSLVFQNDIIYLIKKLKKIKSDENYEFLMEILNYKKNKIDYMDEYSKKFNDLTFSMSHNDYSKRQFICDDNKLAGIVDFSSCDIVPVSWEIIRSYFLSTQVYDRDIQFDYDLFLQYVGNYIKEFKLNYNDLALMPHLLMYQILLSNYGIMEYINGLDKQEIFKFLRLKHNICLFLDKEAQNISKKLINKYGFKKGKVL